MINPFNTKNSGGAGAYTRMAGDGQTKSYNASKSHENNSTIGADPSIVRNQRPRATGSTGSVPEGRTSRQGEAYPRYYEHDRQLRHDRHHYLRALAGEVEGGYGTEYQRHKEKITRRKDAELGPPGGK